MTIHDDLREVMGLLGKATPGPWEWSVNGNIVPVPYSDTEIAAVYSEHEDDRAPANAEAIIAAVAFLRQHGPALLARQEGEDGETTSPPVAEEKAESVCVHCFSPPHMWGMICCKDYWNDPRTEFLTETQANARRAARSGGGGGG